MFVTVKIGAISGLFVILVILGSSGSISDLTMEEPLYL